MTTVLVHVWKCCYMSGVHKKLTKVPQYVAFEVQGPARCRAHLPHDSGDWGEKTREGWLYAVLAELS